MYDDNSAVMYDNGQGSAVRNPPQEVSQYQYTLQNPIQNQPQNVNPSQYQHQRKGSSAPGTAGFAPFVNQDSSSDSYSDGEDDDYDETESSAIDDYGEDDDSDASSVSEYDHSDKVQRFLHMQPPNQNQNYQ